VWGKVHPDSGLGQMDRANRQVFVVPLVKRQRAPHPPSQRPIHQRAQPQLLVHCPRCSRDRIRHSQEGQARTASPVASLVAVHPSSDGEDRGRSDRRAARCPGPLRGRHLKPAAPAPRWPWSRRCDQQIPILCRIPRASRRKLGLQSRWGKGYLRGVEGSSRWESVGVGSSEWRCTVS